MEVKKKRILWVDIAKALAILSVPISHTLELNSTLRAAIFSFHMPIFFILSGYTPKLATDWPTFWKRLKKNFFCMMIPVFIVLLIFAVREALRFGGIELLPSKILYLVRQYFILPAPDDGYTLLNLTSNWFIISLFLAKILMDIVNIVIKSDKSYLVNLMLGAFGVYLGVSKHFFIPYLDLVLVGIMFIQLGILWRKHEAVIKKYTAPLLLAAFFYWLGQILRGEYIELYTRYYPKLELTFLESIAAVFLVCNFAIVLEESAKKAKGFQQKIVNALVFLGKNTLLFYLIHSLDTSVFFFWDIGHNTFIKIVIRLALNLALFLIAYYSFKFFKIKILPRFYNLRKNKAKNRLN